jgi:hypothetical protein
MGFVAVLVAIGDLAWATGVGTNGPWFLPSISLQVYLVTLLVSTVLVIGLAIVASVHLASIGRSVADLDQRIAVLRGTARTQGASTYADSDEASSEVEAEIDEILGAMERNVTSALVAIKPGPAEFVSVARAPGSGKVRPILRELVSERINIRREVSHIRWVVGGPIAAAILFGGIASVMLPGTEGFGTAHFQLNTTLVLFLAYGWPFLVGWAAAAIAFARPIEPA